MEHHPSWFSDLLNKLFGTPVAALLDVLFPAHHHDPSHAIPDHVAMSLLVALMGMVFVLWLKRRLSAERPGATQQVVEWLITNPLGVGIRDCLDEGVGHGGRKHVAMVGSIAIFILLGSLISVVPGFNSPTATVSVPLACAVLTFLYFNWQGIRHHGLVSYLKHFMGPSPALAVLIFPVEIISTTARILSLTVRLWANIFASEMIYLIFLGMLIRPTVYSWDLFPPLGVVAAVFPLLIPIVFVGLHVFVAVVQSYVFTILPAVYLGLAVAEEH